MLIIDHLVLEFQPGLNVLTGETGAGKSILLDALGFVLGWRGRAELVRSGASQGEVIAEFDLPPGHAAFTVLEQAGLDVEDTLILRRVNRADGRKTAWINDRRCAAELLRQLSATLVELHGQQDDKGLLNPRGHRQILDRFADANPELSATRDAWAALRAARAALTKAEAALGDMRAEEEFLRHAVGELDRLDPRPGEAAELDARRRLMQQSERIREDIARAGQALGNQGAEGAMGDAMRWLDGVSDRAEGRLDAPLAALSRAMEELDLAARGVEETLDALAFNPQELEETEERLFAIRHLARKHNITPEDLPGLAQSLRAKIEALDRGDAGIADLRAKAMAAQSTYDRAAAALHAARQTAGDRLDQAVSAELGPLKMDRAVFATEITDDTPGAAGRDKVAFTVATNPGAPAGPIGKIASGGELSRFLLALKVCLAEGSAGVTMIFDEIDRGVGGATADAVGRRLLALASHAQVLVVTHSPQVAALGAHHWRVEKRSSGDRTMSHVVPLNAKDRIDEIARMVAGDTVTDEARAAARALLAG